MSPGALSIGVSIAYGCKIYAMLGSWDAVNFLRMTVVSNSESDSPTDSPTDSPAPRFPVKSRVAASQRLT